MDRVLHVGASSANNQTDRSMWSAHRLTDLRKREQFTTGQKLRLNYVGKKCNSKKLDMPIA